MISCVYIETNIAYIWNSMLGTFLEKYYFDYMVQRLIYFYFLLQMESGGTVLSTNWSDVGKRKVEINPPDDMEWKKY